MGVLDVAQLAEESPLTPEEKNYLRILETELKLAADNYRHAEVAHVQAKAKYDMAAKSEKDYRSFLENKYGK